MKTIYLSDEDFEILQKHINPSGVNIPLITCKYCGDKEGDVSFVTDHIIPKCKGGTDDQSNKQRICWRCNQAKGTDDEKVFTDWLNRIKKRG